MKAVNHDILDIGLRAHLAHAERNMSYAIVNADSVNDIYQILKGVSCLVPCSQRISSILIAI